MKHLTSKHMLPGSSSPKPPLAILIALSLSFSAPHVPAAAKSPLEETADKATWLIEYAGDGWVTDG